MLLQFSIKNYKTFKEQATLSMIASNYFSELEHENVIKVSKYKVLKSAVIYGANASGKSKFLEALGFMKNFIEESSSGHNRNMIDVQPFLLNSESEHQPSEFEIIFQTENYRFRYGFEVTKEKVISEWLFYKPKTKEIELFYREGEEISVHDDFSRGKSVVNEKLVRDNALLLSTAAQFNDTLANTVLEWFNKLKMINAIKEHQFQGFTMFKIENPEYKNRIMEFLNKSDIVVDDIKNVQVNLDELPPDLINIINKRKNQEKPDLLLSDVEFFHKKLNDVKKEEGLVKFSLEKDESNGTKKLFALAGPILDVLENGHILVVDELDAQLHPNLVNQILTLFNSAEYNPNNAQLIFNTHNTNLLDENLFRRDQIWFTEKNNYGEAVLYSLSDFKSNKVTKRDSFEKNYLNGKYGAIPFLQE